MNQEEELDPKGALRCPFCGAVARIQRWHGGGPQKRFIDCSSDDCPVGPQATGETKAKAIAKWNTRP